MTDEELNTFLCQLELGVDAEDTMDVDTHIPSVLAGSDALTPRIPGLTSSASSVRDTARSRQKMCPYNFHTLITFPMVCYLEQLIERSFMVDQI